MKAKNGIGGPIDFFDGLALLFIGLKLTGNITWSWVWVLLPVWGGWGILALILLVVVILGAFGIPG